MTNSLLKFCKRAYQSTISISHTSTVVSWEMPGHDTDCLVRTDGKDKKKMSRIDIYVDK